MVRIGRLCVQELSMAIRNNVQKVSTIKLYHLSERKFKQQNNKSCDSNVPSNANRACINRYVRGENHTLICAFSNNKYAKELQQNAARNHPAVDSPHSRLIHRRHRSKTYSGEI